MIIIGFPGIGKSTLSRGIGGKYLDLDSSMFNMYNKKIKHWETPYARTAEYLSRKGFHVFVSSHPEVVKALQYSSEIVIMCFPCLELKTEWISRLKNRYILSQLTKDKRAIRRASMFYSQDISKMISEANEYKFPTIVLRSIDYDLRKELEEILSI